MDDTKNMNRGMDLFTMEPPAPTAEPRPLDTEVAAALAMVESSGQYRVLRYVAKPAYRPDFEADRVHHDVVVVVDCEATNGDPASALPIELGACKVAVDRRSGELVAYIDQLSMLEDPGVLSEPGAQAAHGIAPEDLAGKHFDDEAVRSFLSGVSYCVAHNASYDRPVISRRLPAFDALPWACSMREVEWSSRGCSSRALDYLLFKASYVHRPHRALADAEACVALLSHPFEGVAPAFLELGLAVATESHIVIALDSEYDAKEALKARGYRWNSGEGQDGQFGLKAWSSASLHSAELVDLEIDWLVANAYSPRRLGTASVLVASTHARRRHNLDEKAQALADCARIWLRDVNLPSSVRALGEREPSGA